MTLLHPASIEKRGEKPLDPCQCSTEGLMTNVPRGTTVYRVFSSQVLNGPLLHGEGNQAVLGLVTSVNTRVFADTLTQELGGCLRWGRREVMSCPASIPS